MLAMDIHEPTYVFYNIITTGVFIQQAKHDS